MRLLTVTNLYPRPDRPGMGLFNAQLFSAMAAQGTADGRPQTEDRRRQTADRGQQTSDNGQLSAVQVLCLVPEWRVWRWGRIREWSGFRGQGSGGRDQEAPDFFCSRRTKGDALLDAPLRGAASEETGAAGMFTPVVRYLPVFYLPMIGRNASHGTYRWSLRRVADRFRGKVDAVYSSWLYPDGVVGTKLASELGVPSWIMVLGSDTFHLENSLRRREILRACNSASGVICVAPHLKRRLVDAGAEEAKIHVVPNGVDAELFHYRPKEDAWADLRGQEMDCSTKPLEEKLEENSREKVQPLGSKENNFQFSIFNFQFPTPLILFVGNLVPVKGPDVLLEAFARLAGGQSPELSDPESRIIALCTIGDGPMRGDLARQARRLGIADRVLFLGNRPHEEVALWMNAADCLCLASRDEGMPNVVLEALACGLPVAATDVGGCREMLAGEPACRLARSEDPVDLAGAILGVLNAAVNRADLAARHGERSWNTMAREILARLTIEK